MIQQAIAHHIPHKPSHSALLSAAGELEDALGLFLAGTLGSAPMVRQDDATIRKAMITYSMAPEAPDECQGLGTRLSALEGLDLREATEKGAELIESDLCDTLARFAGVFEFCQVDAHTTVVDQITKVTMRSLRV